MTPEFTESIAKIKEAIWHRRPILADIIKKHSQNTLFEYSRDFLDVNYSEPLHNRQEEVFAVVHKLLEKRLGSAVANGVVDQLRELPLVSTADHHGPITHPFFVNSNIISGIPLQVNRDKPYRYIVDFSFATVSLNNTSYPRGITFYGNDQGDGPFIRLPILPDKLKMSVVYCVRPFTKEDIERAKKELKKKERGGELSEERSNRIIEILNNYFLDPAVLDCPDYNTQITKINSKIWPALFSESDGKNASEEIPSLIYLEIETIVCQLLLDNILTDKSRLLYKLIFEPQYQSLIQKLFDNLPGAFSLGSQWGTHLFWAVDPNLHRVRLVLKDGFLESHDGHLKFELKPDIVAEALRSKKIYPGMMLCYLMISLYYGIKCLGGFSQVHDLTMIKQAWIKLLDEIGEAEESAAIEKVQTKELGGDGMVLAYLINQKGEMTPATGIDMILGKFNTLYSKYIEIAKRVTLSDAMDPMLPEIYSVLYSQPDRDPLLTSVTSKDILLAENFKEKISIE